MDKIYGFDRTRAKVLKRVANERLGLPNGGTSVLPQPPDVPSVRGFIIIFDEEVPAAQTTDGGQTWTLGVGVGHAWKRDSKGSETNPQNPIHDYDNANLVPVRDPVTKKCERYRVFNPNLLPVPSCVPVQVYQDSSGDLYIFELPPENAQAAYLTSTTTTALVQHCTGNCKWVWVEADNAWTLDTDDCSTTTTTTTTTTVDPNTTTTTTTEDCGCPNPLTTTTTTTGIDCQCQYPLHCGGTDGECTFTQCSQYFVGFHVDCTTTTTCDCNTTTTTTLPNGSDGGADCSGECTYFGFGGSFILIDATGCAPIPFINDDGQTCFCKCEPTAQSIEDLGDCDTYTTSCSLHCGEANLGCSGTCVWLWVPEISSWLPYSGSCTSGNPECSCLPPSEDGTTCGLESTPCANFDSSDPTACGSCYTTTTSTTLPPENCPADCKWSWDGAMWLLTQNLCSVNCTCSEPPQAGTDGACEVRWTPCYPIITTTTTSTTTTDCNFHTCFYESDGSNVFVVDHDDCEVGCECADPGEVPLPCNAPPGYQYGWGCKPTGFTGPCSDIPGSELYCDTVNDCPCTDTFISPAQFRCTGGVWVLDSSYPGNPCFNSNCTPTALDPFCGELLGDPCSPEDSTTPYTCMDPCTNTTTTTTTEEPTTTTTTQVPCDGCGACADLAECCGPEIECKVCWSCIFGAGGWTMVYADENCTDPQPDPSVAIPGEAFTLPCVTEADYNYVCENYGGKICGVCSDCTTTTPIPTGDCTWECNAGGDAWVLNSTTCEEDHECDLDCPDSFTLPCNPFDLQSCPCIHV